MTWSWKSKVKVNGTLCDNHCSVVLQTKPISMCYYFPLNHFSYCFAAYTNMKSLCCTSETKWKALSHVRLFATPWTIVHGILQARILKWVTFPFSRGSSQPRSPALQVDSLPAEPQGKPTGSGVKMPGSTTRCHQGRAVGPWASYSSVPWFSEV